MATKLTPSPLVKGVFQLREPFFASPKVAFTVMAIRTFTEILARGTDPMVLVYNPVNLTYDDYQADIQEGALIVTLQSADGQTIYVPNTYILSYPDMGDVEYSQMIIAVSLGALPKSFDASLVAQAVSSTVADVVGVSPEVKVAQSPISETITNDEHVQLVAARRGAQANRSDEVTLARELQRQLDEANALITEYEAIILQRNLHQA